MGTRHTRGAMFYSLGPLFSTQLIYNVHVDTILYRNTTVCLMGTRHTRGAMFYSLGPLFSTQLIYNVHVDTVLYRYTATSVVFTNGMWI